MDLKNKVALITGGSKGMGRAIALKLASQGAHVALVARHEDTLKDAKRECEKLGVKAITIVSDLTKMEQIPSIVEQTVKKLGRLDILINNAGAWAGGPADEFDIEKWDYIIDLNYRSILHLTRHALPEIEIQSEGAVINISSIAGKNSFPGGGVYCSTKHAVTGFNGSLFEDVREKNIKVCALHPGFVDTDLVTSDNLDRSKMIQPEDIAQTVEFVLKFPKTGCPTEITIRPQKSPYT